MKKLLLLILIGVSSCKISPEDKAKKLITENLKHSLHDFKSYEPVEYGKLDSTYSDCSETPEYIKADKKGKEFTAQMDDYAESSKFGLAVGTIKYSEYKKQLTEYHDSALFYLNIKQKMMDTSIERFVGWHMIHSLRAKNLMGSTAIHHYRYFFNIQLSELIKSEDVSETQSK